ncbi:porin [Duodenibacillus massiliensis]|uniref:porin n=1 Tax=Duodenibacillus massiliensis TaxID=1852381 RepID=UPI0023A7C932|nr:porin [Duodenibacillus massiliensis]
MQKKLIAVAVLGACVAGSAFAANVDVYGRIDTGLSYVHYDETGLSDAKDTLSLDSGLSSGNRWGLKGSEDLGNGYQVGFVLESGFDADTGALGAGGIFGREATLRVSGPFGSIYAGRMGRIGSDAGSVGFYAGSVSPFGSGWGKMAGHFAVTANYDSRYNNALAYVSPKVGPVTVYAQYTMGNTTENESGDDRLFSLGAQADFGALQVLGLVEYLNKKSVAGTTVYDDSQYDDSYTINLGGSYDFSVAKVFLAGQYFKAAPNYAGMKANYAKLVGGNEWRYSFDGFGVNVGATAPIGAGQFLVSAGYGKGDVNYNTQDAKISADAYIIQVGYTYPFSKRTNLYAGAGYMQTSMEDGYITDNTTSDKDFKTTQVMFGLLHKF